MGGPETWFSRDVLADHEVYGFTFDFFVKWNTTPVTLTSEVWVKRILEARDELIDCSLEDVSRKLYLCDTEEYVRNLAQFTSGNNMSLKYYIFADEVDWDRQPETIYSLELSNDGEVIDMESFTVTDVMKRIQINSGGPISVGSKGLIYGTSSLEGYLSKTTAAWPGDVDLVLTNRAGVPIGLLEYKKHTLSDSIRDQHLSKYYPYPDARKYNRLQVLAERLKVPIVIIYYPTKPYFTEIKIERIGGTFGNLTSLESVYCDIPKNNRQKSELMGITLQLAGI